MRTKTFSAKRLLSLLLTVAMFATMILPTNVFAAVSNMSTTLGTDKLYVDVEADFTVTTVANDDLNKMVMGQFVIENADEDDIASLTYYGVMEDAYLTLPIADDGAGNLVGQFGPAATGFPMSDATSKFKVTFKNAGDYEVNVSVVEFGTTNVVASCDATVEVVGYADYTALTAAIAEANNYIANESLYTTASINAVKDAKDVAENVNDKLYADNTSAITNAITDIEDAIAALEELADYTDLTVAYNAGSAITNDNGTYTAKTFKALTDALTGAAKDENKELTVQDDVDALTKAINDAITGLVKNVEVTFTAVAVANDAKVDYAKANKIVLVFAEPVKDAENKLISKLNIADEISAANWTTDTVYTLTLKDNHSLTNNAEVTFDGDETIFTVSGNAMADADANVIGNLTEAYQQVTATKMAATIVNNDDKPGADAGDKIVLVFNAPVKDNPDDIAVSGMTAEVVAGTNNTVYVITLDGTENVNDDTKLTFGAIANVELNGTFGTAVAPKALVAVAVDKDGTAKKTNDEIVVVFDRPTNGSVDISALSIFSDAGWNDVNTELTLKVAGETGINSTIDISSMGIMDKDSIVAATNTSNLALLGSFGTVTAPAVLSMTAVDVDGTAKTENDLVVIVFDRPTNGSTDISGLSDFVDVDWEENNTKLILTVGAGATIKNGDTLDIASMGIKDKDDLVDATNTEMILDGSFGTVTAPIALRAYAVDNDGTELVYNVIDEVVYKDQIVVVFNTPTNMPDDISKINVIGTGYTASLGTKAELDWEEDGTKLVITLGQDTFIKNGVTIDLTNLGIMDKDEIVAADVMTLELDVEGSFGYTIQPRITKAVAFTQGEEDYIRVFFNTEVAGTEVVDATINGFTMGPSAQKKLVDNNNGFTYYEIVMAKDEHSAFVSGEFEITLTGIVDKYTKSKELSPTPFPIKGAFVSPIKPELLKVVAISNDGSGIAKAGDKIVAVFNTEVKLGEVSVINGHLGVNSEVKYSSTAKNVVEIILGEAHLDVVPGITKLNFTGFMDEGTESVTMADVTKTIEGSFGYSEIPKIMSATAIDVDGTEIPKVGDKIIVVFNTMVEYGGEEIYYYEHELSSDNQYAVNGTYTITVTSKDTGISYTLSATIGGSFGYSTLPTVKSVVLSEGTVGEIITVIFDGKTNKVDLTNVQEFKSNNTHLDVVASAWNIEGDVLTIGLGAGATTTKDDVLDLSGLGICSADTSETIEGLNALPIKGSLIPVFTDAEAYENKIIVKFSTRTNSSAKAIEEIEKQTALYGTGVQAYWEDNKTLVIEMSDDNSLPADAHILLNGLEIKDGFSESVEVWGQYPIKTTFLTKNLLSVKVYANGAADAVRGEDKNAALAGDKILVVFDAYTNGVEGADAKDKVALSDTNLTFGEGYTATWTSKTTITIVLGEGTTVTTDSIITVKDVRFANGTGKLSDSDPSKVEVEIGGLFDGKKFWVEDLAETEVSGLKRYSATIKKGTMDALNVADMPYVICQGYDSNNKVISINAIQISDMVEQKVRFDFNNNAIAKVEIFVSCGDYADINATVAPGSEPVSL